MITTERLQSIRSGLLEFALLAIVSRRPVYAADILEALAKTEFKTQEGTLYPLLSRLRREELLEYDWQESELGPPRKYYSLTKKGEKHLEELQEYWNILHKTLNSFRK